MHKHRNAVVVGTLIASASDDSPPAAGPGAADNLRAAGTGENPGGGEKWFLGS